MPAQESYWRNINRMHVVFCASAVALFASTIWMMAADHRDEWRAYQKTNDQIRAEIARVEETEIRSSDDYDDEIDRLTKERAEATKKVDEEQATIDRLREEVRVAALAEDLVAREVRILRARRDVARADYDLLVRDSASSDALERSLARFDKLQAQVDGLELDLQRKQAALNEKREALQAETRTLDEINAQIKRADSRIAALNAQLDQLAPGGFSGVKRKLMDLPIIDGFNSPHRIVQDWLPDLKTKLGMANTARFDRCRTCHLNIDAIKPGPVPAFPHGEFDSTEFDRRLAAGEFQTGLLRIARSSPRFRASVEARIRELEDANPAWKSSDEARAERRAALNDPDNFTALLSRVAAELSENQKWVLSGKYPHPFATHPRVDLYLTSQSPHKLETFGCTACHDGQGSGTSFSNASHTPNDPFEEHEWAHAHHYASNHFWEYPMQPKRLRESTCLKCHHTVTELAVNPQFGETAPQLVHGWRLIKEYGCFGCHEINGYDGGKPIGPDIRLEPQTAEEAERIAADPSQVAGQMRKVGPSLRHVASKVSQGWLEKWTEEPARFRPNTRMPQFYHLSNQHDDAAERFTPVELAGISHYLFGRSEPLELDEPAKDYVPDPARGLRLFSERGCLACHSHSGKEFAGADATFGPTLDRVFAKLRPEDTVDFNGVPFNKWLYTWIRNPEGHHPRTRMPNLFLTTYTQPATDSAPPAEVDPAADIAAWLIHRGNGGGAIEWNGAKEFLADPLAFEAATDATKDERAAIAQRNHDLQKLTRLLLERAITRRLTDRILGSEVVQPSGEVSTASQTALVPAENRYPSDAAPPIKGDEIELVHSGAVTAVDGKASLTVDFVTPPEGLAENATLVFTSGDWQGRKFSVATADAAAGAVTLTLSPADQSSEKSPKPGDRVYLNGRITPEMQLRYIGRKTISKYGCYGCHDIPGFEEARPIGTALQDWGRKDPSRLAPEHIHEYLHHHGEPDGKSTSKRVEDAMKAAAADEFASEEDRERELGAAFFYENLLHHGRPGFIWQKLREPRSYDYRKTESKGYDERLRMPKFPLTEHEIQAIATFVLGLVAEPPAESYVYRPTGAAAARLEGERLLEKYHCTGCHSVELPSFTIRAKPGSLPSVSEMNPDSYYPEALALLHHIKPVREIAAALDSAGQATFTFRGSEKLGPDPDLPEEDQVHNLIIWENLALRWSEKDPETKTDVDRSRTLIPMTPLDVAPADLVSRGPARGGEFAFWLIGKRVGAARSPERIDSAWQSAPPTLYREGVKVQTPWLYRFLKEPFQLRHTTLLRMPRFNMSDDEARALANYFAAADEVSFPYQDIPQRDVPYLRSTAHAALGGEGSVGDYLSESWRLLTKDKVCINCHSVGGLEVQVDPKQPQPRGPDLFHVAERLQPDWTLAWLYNPKWITPYTSMPAVFGKGKPPDETLLHGDSRKQAVGTRDALINYHRLLEEFGKAQAPAAPAAEGAGGD